MKNINPEESKEQNFFLLEKIILFMIFFAISEVFIVRPLRKKIERRQELAKSEFANKDAENDSISEFIEESEEFVLENDYIKLTMSTNGLKLNNLTLKKYFDNDNNNIKLLDDNNYVKINWLSYSDNLVVPDKNSVWTLIKQGVDDKNNRAILTFDNGNSVIFKVIITLDDKYLIDIKQIVENNTKERIYIKPFWSLTKSSFLTKSDMTSFGGAIGLFNGGVNEIKTKKIRNDNLEIKNFEWAGITSKYWLTALINGDKDNGKINFYEKNGTITMQYTTKENIIVSENSFTGFSNSLFVGVKDIHILKEYSKENNIRLLDRSVDFGFFYILAKPIDILLNFLNKIVKNFGVAIIILTLIVKTILYPITKKSLVTVEVMKEVQPKMKKIQDIYKNDRIKMQQELVKIYKKYNLNPLASIMPIFIQIPVFISVYKVISVSLSMRQAPFLGFIKDLSIADPSNIFNLFGLLNYNTKFKLGFLPCLMGLTMFMQQKFSEKLQKNDGNSDMVGTNMNFMPIIFTLIFASSPSGLLIYWICSNVVTLLQQWYIVRFCLKKK